MIWTDTCIYNTSRHTHACTHFHVYLHIVLDVHVAFIVYVQMKQSIDCDKLLTAVKGGSFEEVDAIMKQLIPSKSHKLFSDVSHLVLQLAVCYGYASLVESLVLQYKVQRKYIVLLCL